MIRLRGHRRRICYTLEKYTEEDAKGPPMLLSEFEAALSKLEMEKHKESLMEYCHNC